MYDQCVQKLKHINRQRNIKTKVLKNKIYFSYLSFIKKRTNLDPISYKNIAILMTDLGIGDVIVTSFLIKSLKQAGYHVSVIVEERISYLFDEFIDIDRKILLKSMNSLKEFRLQCEESKIDLLIDLFEINGQTNKRISLIHNIKPLHTIGFNQTSKLYDTSIEYKEYYSHFTTRMIKILELLNIKNDTVKYYLNVPPSAYEEAQFFISKHKLENKKIIIFNPFGSFKIKSFSYQQIEEIMQFLSKYEDTVTIIVGEKNKLSLIKNSYENILIGTFSSFFTVIALIDLSHLLITVDTSVVHVANAYNKKLISIYNNMLLNGFESNYAWSPNYSNAKQIFTKECTNTSSGDDISKINLDELFIEIAYSLK